jgi:hypothetical protein
MDDKVTPTTPRKEAEEIAMECVPHDDDGYNKFNPSFRQMRSDITQALQSKQDEIDRLKKEIEHSKQPTLYGGLCKTIIGRILEAEANCEPEHDILLRLETIIIQRDRLTKQVEKLEYELALAKARSDGFSSGLIKAEAQVEKLTAEIDRFKSPSSICSKHQDYHNDCPLCQKKFQIISFEELTSLREKAEVGERMAEALVFFSEHDGDDLTCMAPASITKYQKIAKEALTLARKVGYLK